MSEFELEVPYVKDRIIRFADQSFTAQVDHGGTGLVLSGRARKAGDGVHCNFIDCVVVPAGASIGLHRHECDNEELYVIVSGSGVITVETQEHPVQQGDIILNPPGGAHGLRNDSLEDLKLVVVEYPARS
jgi:mannose-6-phosphate isomerase-like protein (cupin superfamily)